MNSTETDKQGGNLPAFVRPLFVSLYQFMRNDPNADRQEVDEYRVLAGLKNQGEFQAAQREADELSMFHKQMIGIRFSGALVVDETDDQFRKRFGEHNARAKVVRDNRNRIRGFSRNVCLCDVECLPRFCQFLFANPGLEIEAQQAGLYSIMRQSDGTLCCEIRTEALGLELKRKKTLEDARRQNLIRQCEQQQVAMGAIPHWFAGLPDPEREDED